MEQNGLHSLHEMGGEVVGGLEPSGVTKGHCRLQLPPSLSSLAENSLYTHPTGWPWALGGGVNEALGGV